MKEVKFRAWDGTRLFTVTDISWCACEPIRPVSVEGFIMENGVAQCCIWDEGDVPEIILLQYTGLKDKNGKEIYEGDRVRILYTDWPSKSDDDPRTIDQYMVDIAKVGIVQQEDAEFLLEFKDGTWGFLNEGVHGFKKIIGNIYIK